MSAMEDEVNAKKLPSLGKVNFTPLEESILQREIEKKLVRNCNFSGKKLSWNKIYLCLSKFIHIFFIQYPID
jgi:hypothetical protein